MAKHTHTHIGYTLGTKNISISDEAYSRLAAHKGYNESFTDVINRLTRKKSILDLVGVLNYSQAEEVRSEIRKMRKRSAKRVSLTVKKMK